MRPLRIRRIRKRSEWQTQLGLEDDVRPGELSQLPECIEDDVGPDDQETDGNACDRPSGPQVAEGASGGRSAEPGGGESPGKLRHLRVAAERGHLEAMYLLAQECEDRVARIHWLTMAAERGHLPAMHDLGLASVALHERRRWLLRAAQNGWAEAMAELGDVECS